MEQFQYDAFGKKIALFYHPLFRKTIEAWSAAFAPQSKNINMVVFMELNVRIQKAMIYPADTTNSMNSALTDWFKELEDISLREKKPPLHSQKNSQPKYNLPDLPNIFNSLQFEPCISQEGYISFFKQHKQHVAMKYSQTLLSLIGFSKFLFDLCVSWCENLDIELFLYFLNGLFLHITSGDTLKSSSLRSLSKIELFIDSFYNLFKNQKAHYQRYVKSNLTSLQTWCEWNYFRIKEIKNRLIENFLQVFPETEKQRVMDLQDIFDSAQSEIPSDLTTFNLKTLSQFQPTNGLSEKSFGAGKPNLEMYLPTSRITRKDAKKVSMPVIGKSLGKSNTDDSNVGVVKTIDSVAFFLEDLADPEYSPTRDIAQNGLYPIWERELSECNSTMSFRDLKSIKYSMSSTQQDFIDGDHLEEYKSPKSRGSSSNFKESQNLLKRSISKSNDEDKAILVVEGRAPNHDDSTIPSIERLDGLTSDENFNSNKDLSHSIPQKNSSKGFVQNETQIFQQKVSDLTSTLPNSVNSTKSLSSINSTKHQPEVKRGGYIFTKRKQNLTPSFNSAQGHFPIDFEKRAETDKLSSTLDPSSSSKRVKMPKLIPKPLQYRKDTSRGRNEKENVLAQRKPSAKRLTQTQYVDIEGDSTQENDHLIGLSKDSLNLPRSFPDLDRTGDKIKQIYNRSETLRLPRTNKDLQSGTEQVDSSDRIDTIGKGSLNLGLLPINRKTDLRKELAEIGSKPKLKKIPETKRPNSMKQI